MRAVVASGATAARASAVTTVLESTPLGLAVVARPDPVAPGETLTYEVTVTNRSATDAADVQVRLQIPTGVAACLPASDDGTFPSGCGVGRDIVWDLNALAAGASRTMQAVFITLAASGLPDGTLIHVAARAQDGAGDGARAATIITARAAAPLMLGVEDDTDPARFGDAVVYTLRFGNRSVAATLNTALAVTLPTGVTVTAAPGATVSGNTVTWALGTVNAGDSGERDLTVRVDDLGATDPLVRLTRAVVASGTTTARAGALTTVAPALPLDLAMVATPDPVGRNVVLTYQLTVTNTGPASANVQLRMQIPAGVASCQGASDNGTFPSGCGVGRDIVWDLGSVAMGAARSVTATFRTLSTVATLPNGTIIHATARSEDGGGNSARAAASTSVFQ